MRPASSTRSRLLLGVAALTLASCGGQGQDAPVAVLPAPSPALVGEVGARTLGDSLFPQLGNGGYDALHYTLNLDSRPATGELVGQVAMQARATQPLRAFTLDFTQFTPDRVTVDGVGARFESQAEKLFVELPTVKNTGQPFTVEVSYRGFPRPVASEAVPTVKLGWVPGPGGSYALGEPEQSHTWFPVNDHPLDKATYEFHIRVPAGFQAVANGRPTDARQEGATTVYSWVMDDPMASYLATVVVGDMVRHELQGPSGIPFSQFIPRSNPELAEPMRLFQTATLSYLLGRLGPFPLAQYGGVALSPALVDEAFVHSALETQGMPVFGPEGVLLDTIFAHEAAHEWMGNGVSVSDWGRDIWWVEGFGKYSEFLYLEHTLGRAAYLATIRRSDTLVRGISPRVLPGRPTVAQLFDDATYRGGALLYHSLRWRLGDNAFFGALREFQARYGGGNGTTEGLIAIFEQTSGEDLDAFFAAWLYGPVMPEVPVTENPAR